MKKRLLIATCLFAVGIQNLTAQDYLDVAGDHARLYVGRVEPQYQLTAWRDNPYYGRTWGVFATMVWFMIM